MIISVNSSFHFDKLCDDLRLKQNSITVKNPQANTLLKDLHKVIGNMLHISNLDLTNKSRND